MNQAAVDYKSLGLKAGIEIHQQLDTKEKLFCSCPTTVRDDKADVVVKRRLRAAAGETGEMDVAAAYEQLRGKHFVYNAYGDTTCDVELDEEPIHGLNSEALQIALQVALLLKAKPVDRIQVMRKTVVDGSNTSGFQRTALVAMNGKIAVDGRAVGISSVCVEEESAKIVERAADCDVYNLSRLGIPLVEVATAADMKTPEQVKEVAEYIGMVLRSTGKVKRGLGTIRQDVNVSIREGARVEIKGAQELRLIPKLVEYEALRQKGLAEVAAELRNRKASVGKTVDVTKALENCASDVILSVTVKGGAVLAAKLAGFKGLVGKHFLPEGHPVVRLGKELSGYARAYAGVGGVVHSDELPKYGITAEYVEEINHKLGCGSNDAFIIVAAEKGTAESGMSAALDRARQAIKGVPSEVRKANDDGTTTFLRPMPGSARMYPETDVPLVAPQLGGITLPRLLIEKAADYQKLGLSPDLAKSIVRSEYAELFEGLVSKCPSLNPAYIADTLMSFAKEMAILGVSAEAAAAVSDDSLRQVFAAVNSGKLAKESVVAALADAAKTGKLDLSRHGIMSDAELEKELKAIVAANKSLPFNALVGKAMERLRGKAPGQKIVEKLKTMTK
ncbi:Glu-tRNA(Gln) amidotransferase subunit GatE [Candidatus Woesearchaeota archaeon]|nr:Glu-tRNA(Gln) amidotransferase subunit GatE [Candidatus Woesearchaeota archaeon]